MKTANRPLPLFAPLMAAVAILGISACQDMPTDPELATQPQFAKGGGGTKGGPISITECGTVISQSGKYSLDADLTGCTGDGIVIAASDVTLHLGGHTATSAPWGPGIGLDIRPGSNNVSVHGPGTFDGFSVGGALEGVTGSRMSGVTITHSTFQGFVVNYDFSETATVRSSGNEFYDNLFIDNLGHGVTMNGGDNNKFRGNVSVGNGGSGYFMYAADGNDFKGNEATGNVGFGFWAWDGGASGNVIQGNSASGNGWGDAYDGDVCDNSWIGNTFAVTGGVAGCVG